MQITTTRKTILEITLIVSLVLLGVAMLSNHSLAAEKTAEAEYQQIQELNAEYSNAQKANNYEKIESIDDTNLDIKGMFIGFLVMLGVCFLAIYIALLRNVNGYQGTEIKFKRAKVRGGKIDNE